MMGSHRDSVFAGEWKFEFKLLQNCYCLHRIWFVASLEQSGWPSIFCQALDCHNIKLVWVVIYLPVFRVFNPTAVVETFPAVSG